MIAVDKEDASPSDGVSDQVSPGFNAVEYHPPRLLFTACPRVRLVVLGEGEVGALAGVVEDDEEGEAAHGEVGGDGEGGGGFHVDGEVALSVPGVDLGVALCEQRGSRANRAAMALDVRVDSVACPIDEVEGRGGALESGGVAGGGAFATTGR